MWLRVTRHAVTIEVAYSVDGTAYYVLRQTYLTGADTLQVGVMVYAPTGEGFPATFEGFAVQENETRINADISA